MLKQLKLDSVYKGCEKVTGELYSVEDIDDSPGAFRAYLDVGLARTSTGARIFGAMKGAVDGGIDIPHSEKRFPGYSAETKTLNAELHRKLILGGHVADYMRSLQEEDEEAYKRQFSRYIKMGITPDEVSLSANCSIAHCLKKFCSSDQIEDIYIKAHAAIRANPDRVSPKPKENITKKRWNKKKLTLAARRNKIAQKKATVLAKLDAEKEA